MPLRIFREASDYGVADLLLLLATGILICWWSNRISILDRYKHVSIGSREAVSSMAVEINQIDLDAWEAPEHSTGRI